MHLLDCMLSVQTNFSIDHLNLGMPNRCLISAFHRKILNPMKSFVFIKLHTQRFVVSHPRQPVIFLTPW